MLGGMLTTDLVPSEIPDSRRLMIVLHGLGDSMAGYRWFPEALALPRMNYLLVNAPDPYYDGYSWYDIYGDAPSGIERSRALLFKLLDDQAQAGFPTDQTILFGFSQGCLMTIETACRHPRLLAGNVGISGYVHDAAALVRELSPVARQQKFLITHGTDDPLLPIEKVRPDIERLRQAGLNIDYQEYPKVHTIAGEEEIRRIRDFVTGCFPG